MLRCGQGTRACALSTEHIGGVHILKGLSNMTPYRHMHTGPGTIEMAINRHRMAHAATSNLRLSVPFDLPASCPQPEPHPLYFLCRVYDSDVVY
jgi:hypothetical protein